MVVFTSEYSKDRQEPEKDDLASKENETKRQESHVLPEKVRVFELVLFFAFVLPLLLKLWTWSQLGQLLVV